MDFPIFLAHGALGYWDEIIFLGVVIIFMILMGISWVRSRANAEGSTDHAALMDATPEDNATSERFKLQ